MSACSLTDGYKDVTSHRIALLGMLQIGHVAEDFSAVGAGRFNRRFRITKGGDVDRDFVPYTDFKV